MKTHFIVFLSALAAVTTSATEEHYLRRGFDNGNGNGNNGNNISEADNEEDIGAKANDNQETVPEERDLQSVWFQLKSGYATLFGDADYCLDVSGGIAKNFKPLQIWHCNGSAAQKFSLDGNGHLRSKVNPNICVEMDPQYGIFLHSACMDQWEVDNSSPYGPFMKNVGDGMCMAVSWETDAIANGSPVIRESCSDFSTNAKFTME